MESLSSLCFDYVWVVLIGMSVPGFAYKASAKCGRIHGKIALLLECDAHTGYLKWALGNLHESAGLPEIQPDPEEWETVARKCAEKLKTNLVRIYSDKRREAITIIISIPYNPELSKNRMWLPGKYGKLYRNPATAAEQDAIAMLIQAKRKKWQKKTKLHVNIMVYRPHMKGDPANFTDTILDAVQVGTGVNDRYYTDSCDWKLDKENPRIEITVSQTVEGNVA